jgi:hypothetical protein
MAKRNTVKLTESKLQEMVIDAVKAALNEGFLDNVGNKIKQGYNAVNDKIYDFHQGYETKEGNPQSLEDVFDGNGYNVVKTFNKNGATYYAVKPVTGAFAEHFGAEKDAMAEELNIFLNGNGTATYAGPHPKYRYIELFKIDF